MKIVIILTLSIIKLRDECIYISGQGAPGMGLEAYKSSVN